MTCCQIIVKKIADQYRTKVGDVMKLIANSGDKTNRTEIVSYTCLQE